MIIILKGMKNIMLNNLYDEMNKTLLKTDVLLETVCQYYDIDAYYSESVDVLLNPIITLLKKQNLYLNL